MSLEYEEHDKFTPPVRMQIALQRIHVETITTQSNSRGACMNALPDRCLSVVRQSSVDSSCVM